jgi:hypothetical protein
MWCITAARPYNVLAQSFGAMLPATLPWQGSRPTKSSRQLYSTPHNTQNLPAGRSHAGARHKIQGQPATPASRAGLPRPPPHCKINRLCPSAALQKKHSLAVSLGLCLMTRAAPRPSRRWASAALCAGWRFLGARLRCPTRGLSRSPQRAWRGCQPPRTKAAPCNATRRLARLPATPPRGATQRGAPPHTAFTLPCSSAPPKVGGPVSG